MQNNTGTIGLEDFKDSLKLMGLDVSANKALKLFSEVSRADGKLVRKHLHEMWWLLIQ